MSIYFYDSNNITFVDKDKTFEILVELVRSVFILNIFSHL